MPPQLLKRTQSNYLALLVFFLPAIVFAAPPPSTAVKFSIIDPADSTVGIAVIVTIEARKQNNQVDTNYQQDVTLVTSGSATGGGLVDIVNGVGTAEINDLVAETITLSLSDTEATGLDISSTQNVVFASAGAVSWNQQSFQFYDDDGGEGAATGFGLGNLVADTVINNLDGFGYNQLHFFRLRISFKAEQAAGNIVPRLEFLEYWEQMDQSPPTCSSILAWQEISANTAVAFSLRDSRYLIDLSSTTRQIGGGGPNWTAGLVLDVSNPAPLTTLTKNQVTEYEWSLQYNRDFSRGYTGPNFLFRISNSGTALNSYTVCPLVSLAFPYETKVSPTTVTFSGKAFPGAKIIVIEKNPMEERPISQKPVSSEEGEFRISYIGILQTDHSYGLIIEDASGRRTQTKFYNIDTVSNSLTEKDIFSSPTIDLYRSSVTKGDFIKVIGSASAGNKILVQLDNNITYETSASSSGQYQMLINTARLPFGTHTLRAKQREKVGFKESDWSTIKSFSIVATVVPEADFNSDGIIDIKDWSVFLSRWKGNSEARKILDLNHDGKVDLSDLGIFLRAYRQNK